MVKVEWTKNALEDLEKLDKPITKRILKKISWLSQHFDNITPEPLSANFAGTLKLRIGDWRVVYTIEYRCYCNSGYRSQKRSLQVDKC